MKRDPVEVMDGLRAAARLTDAVHGDGNISHVLDPMSEHDLRVLALTLAEQLVAARPSGNRPKVRTVREIGRIAGVVSHLTSVAVPEIYGRNRTREVAHARHIVCHVAFHLDITVVEIGLALDRDHGTVSSSVARVRNDATLRDLAHQTLTYLSRSTP